MTDSETLPDASQTVSFLGPAGTFTEAALKLAPEAKGKHWKPVANVLEALMDVQQGRSFAAMVAIENSVEGGVTASQDALSTMDGLRIIGEYIVPIRFVLATRPGTTMRDVQTVAAHPVAYGQCRRWLHQALPEHLYVQASSNVASARQLFEEDGLADAAIAPPTIQDHFDVDILAEDIQDSSIARTRFLLVTTRTDLPSRTGTDKTSLIVTLPDERPGGLLSMLEQFAARGINLSMITSRPIPESPGRYRFVIDLDGHLEDARVADALLGLRRYSPSVKFLGSYPRAVPSPVAVDPAYSDENYAEARGWLDGLVR
ncbi:prephenate dehydratase [Gulosibacter molinativorax]|uniref:Prephenate dehydratase n=1 Tax=Gulosibacter molinativorax TaxID=256821 RepID=A0ABT7C6P4_9MICO|nr:prephenate dehydratase [Gulosibacter molinativorax]MDJ1370695.1 prephenate dehydratase [Gulosibacter molinativorax]QUY63278.1 Prephenate dehydratase [Gulosibacter molinativorax]